MSYLPAMNRIEVGTVLRPSLQEQRHDVKLSLNFHLSAEAVRAGSLEVVLHRLIVPGGVDLRPASPQPVQVNFVAAPLLRVRAIWLRCKSQLDGPPVFPDSLHFEYFHSYLKWAYPVAQIEWSQLMVDSDFVAPLRRANVSPSSLDVVEQFFGEPLSEEHIGALKDAPDEQIIDLFGRFNDAWIGWFDDRFDKGLTPDQHYFVGEARSEVEPLPLEKYKQLALYFPVIATPDPMEARLGSHVLTAQMTQQVLTASVRDDMLIGLTRLAQIAPLVRAQAVSLVPTVQVLLSEGVQGVARREIHANGSESADPTTESFALATGVCSMAAYWPVASTGPLWRRLQAGGTYVAEQLGKCNLPIAQAVAEFDVPSVSRLQMRDLLKLRANEASFADFREAFGVAMRESLDQSRVHGPDFGKQFFRDRLKPHQERCNATAEGTSAFDGMLLPAGAAFAVGGLSWLLATVDNPFASFDNLEKALINVVAPGAAWLAMGQLQRLIAKRRPGNAVYSALVDRCELI